MAPVRIKETKALPARPESDSYKSILSLRDEDDDELDDFAVIETATMTRIGGRSPVPVPTVVRQPDESLGKDPALEKLHFVLSNSLPDQRPLQSSFSRSPGRSDSLILQRPTEDQYLPPPLSPKRPLSPGNPREPSPEVGSGPTYGVPPPDTSESGHLRAPSVEPGSWLDPIDESGGSAASSVHSRSSSLGIRRKHIRAASGDTEAEFDAALDAAVEAAYDDGYEPMEDDEVEPYEDGDLVVANALRKVEIAKERVRQTAREALELEQERERRRKQQDLETDNEPVDFYEGDSSDEGERIFEEMSRGYSIDDFSLRSKQKPAVGRDSDSSALTTRTWQSSMASNTASATTMSTLSTVTENPVVSSFQKMPNGTAPPPAQALPELPAKASQLANQRPAAESVRNRRLSGQNPKQLKIETSGLGQNRQPPPAVSTMPESSPIRNGGPAADLPPTPPLTYSVDDDEEGSLPRSDSPSTYMPILRTTYSETSLRSLRSRNMSTSNLDDASDASPRGGSQFNPDLLNGMPNLPTPLAASFRDKISGESGGGLFLFDDNIHSPYSPGSPNPLLVGAPVPLEPCPTDSLLRPFWLMRCLYQTLAHPRGGYLSSKLFVPRDVWKVKGVKLKNVDEKMACCDYLTAALLKLAQVNTYDADAVLEEMSIFEKVLDQVQPSLTKKLGTEVGNQGSGSLFKDPSGTVDDEPSSAVPRSASVTGKTSTSFSWRRLRTKNSSVGLGTAYGGKEAFEGSKDSLSLASLPMTSHPTSRPSKRDLGQAQFGGPHAEYMNSLARLFDAAQALGTLHQWNY
jgi:hypothetical protein